MRFLSRSHCQTMRHEDRGVGLLRLSISVEEQESVQPVPLHVSQMLLPSPTMNGRTMSSIVVVSGQKPLLWYVLSSRIQVLPSELHTSLVRRFQISMHTKHDAVPDKAIRCLETLELFLQCCGFPQCLLFRLLLFL